MAFTPKAPLVTLFQFMATTLTISAKPNVIIARYLPDSRSEGRPRQKPQAAAIMIAKIALTKKSVSSLVQSRAEAYAPMA